MILSKSRCKVISVAIRYIQVLQAYFTVFSTTGLENRYSLFQKSFSKNTFYTETSKFICDVNQFTGVFFVILAFRQIYLAYFILLFRVKENLKDVFDRALIRFRFPDSRLKLPLLSNESISGYLYVKDF